MTAEQIARVCHEANRAYSQSIGDFSHQPWDDAPIWQRESAIAGVGYYRLYPDATPKDLHSEWMRVKKEEGWKYGPVKSELLKEHPCLLEYEELPEVQKRKMRYSLLLCEYCRIKGLI